MNDKEKEIISKLEYYALEIEHKIYINDYNINIEDLMHFLNSINLLNLEIKKEIINYANYLKGAALPFYDSSSENTLKEKFKNDIPTIWGIHHHFFTKRDISKNNLKYER